MNVSRAPFPWMGGKYRMVKHILPLIPEHTHYVEPYFGAGSLFWNREQVGHSTINDINGDVVNFFEVLRDKESVIQLIDLLSLTPYSRQEYANCIKKLESPDTLTNVERARCFYVIIRQGSVMVLNRKPFTDGNWFKNMGVDKSITFQKASSELMWFSEKLKSTGIECRDAFEVLNKYDRPDTFFYLDPPYIPDTRICGGYKHDTDIKYHERLVDIILKLKGKIILSGYNSAVYNPLVDNGWEKVDIDHKCNICFKSRDTTECLWINPAAQK